PCHNCILTNVPCTIGVSKRGKYPRKKTVRDGPKTATPLHTPAPSSHIADNKVSLSLANDQHSLARRHLLGSSTAPLISEQADYTHQTIFLGESSPLTVVVDEGRHSSPNTSTTTTTTTTTMPQTRLCYPIPGRSNVPSARDEALRVRKLRMEHRLQADGAFSFPPPSTCALLLQAYFNWFHPCFPILDRADVQHSYLRGTLSPLLLHAMLFIGVSLCPDDALARTEFVDRHSAKFLFYSRAKALYGEDWEGDKTVKLQTLFLLSFWRGGPSEERDVRFWLGIAISLAQKRGMHVMAKFSLRSAKEERLWKRIWWALYTRDQQSAAALGLPPRIRDEDCDVAMLAPDDFRETEVLDDTSVFGVQLVGDVEYPVEMAKLARILRTIVATQYSPTPTLASQETRKDLHRQLIEWESSIPAELRQDSAVTPRAKFLTGLIHMTYYNLYILLYRPLLLHSPEKGTGGEGQIAVDAATRSTRIVEDMLSHNVVQHGPTHLITHVFSTLCIHTLQFRRETGTGRQLAEHRARLCLLGLQELQKSWDLENWVLELFF
ncbi:fungal specific transcription factor domain-containing protein, partial [Aspergillus aculeatinus CBS 121060]